MEKNQMIFYFSKFIPSMQWLKSRTIHTVHLEATSKKPYTFNTKSFKKSYFHPYIQADSLSFEEIYSLGATLQRKECTLN